MNIRVLGLSLALACAYSLCATAQEPPGCSVKRTRSHLLAESPQKSEITGKLPKRRVLDLRKKKKTIARQSDGESQMPIIASPIYLPQASDSGTAITASNGYLYVVVGETLYKVNEKSLKTVQVSRLSRSPIKSASSSETPKRHKKMVASTDDEPSPRATTKKRHSSKTD